jgi:competence protein ComGC
MDRIVMIVVSILLGRTIGYIAKTPTRIRSSGEAAA